MTGKDTPPPPARAPDAARVAAGLRAFVVERLATFACSDERHDPKITARAVADLTRCLRELVALEKSLNARPAGVEGGEDDEGAADLDAGAAHALADVVAREGERVHERDPEGGGGDAL
jgi:hypothetical protein